MNEDSNNDDRFSGVIGEDYDSTFELICPHLVNLETSVAKGLNPLKEIFKNSDLKLIDLGCGDGLTAKSILKEFNNITLILNDNEKQMLKQAEENLSAGTNNIKFILKDALSYLKGIESNSIHGIGSCFVIHNWQDEYRLKILKEIYRVLKPRGIFVNADKIAEPRPKHDKVFAKQLELVINTYTEHKRPDLLKEWIVHYLEDNIPGVLWFEKDAIAQLKSVGFKSVENTFRCDLEATLVATKD